MKVPKGIPTGAMDLITSMGEAEFLMPSGCKLQIDAVQRHPDGGHLVDATLIPPGEKKKAKKKDAEARG